MIGRVLLFSLIRDIIMDDRDLAFSKSEDEQSEMSNHDYDQDVKPVRTFFFAIEWLKSI